MSAYGGSSAVSGSTVGTDAGGDNKDAPCCTSKVFFFDKFEPRFYSMLLAIPKLFLAGFLWEGFSLMALSQGYDDRSAVYDISAGSGDFIGVIVGHMAVVLAAGIRGHDLLVEFHVALLLATASGICAGTLWQVSVNLSADGGLSFTAAFCVVTAFSFVSFFVSIILIRMFNARLIPTAYQLCISPPEPKLWHDFQLSVTLAIADGFFTGTTTNFSGVQWLSGFAVTDDMNAGLAMTLAGVCVTCGFLVAQTVQNCLVEDCWLDGGNGQPDKKVKAIGRRLSRTFSQPLMHVFDAPAPDGGDGSGSGSGNDAGRPRHGGDGIDRSEWTPLVRHDSETFKPSFGKRTYSQPLLHVFDPPEPEAAASEATNNDDDGTWRPTGGGGEDVEEGKEADGEFRPFVRHDSETFRPSF